MAGDSLRVGQLYAEFTTKGLSSVTNSMNVLKSKVLNLKTAFLGLTSALGLGKLAKDLISTGAEFETYRKRLLAVTKDQKTANEVFERMSKWAAENPVDTDDAIAAFVRLKSAAVANTEEATQAVGNLAALMGTSMQDAANALVTANARTLRYYGIQLSTAGNEAKIQIGNTVTTVKNGLQEIRQGIVQTIQKEYGGVMDTMKDTWQGNINTMSGMWTDFKRQIAGDAGTGGPFDNLRLLLIDVRKQWEKFTNSNSYPAFVRKVQDGINTMLSAALGAIASVADSLAGFIENFERYASTMEYGLLGKILFGAKGMVIGAAIGLIKDEVNKVLDEKKMSQEDQSRLGAARAKRDAAASTSGLATHVISDEIAAREELAALEKELWAKYHAGATTVANGLKSVAEQVRQQKARLDFRIASRGESSDAEGDIYAGLNSGASTKGKDGTVSSSGTSKTSTAKDRLKAVQKIIQRMRDEVKYAGASVSDFLPVLDQMLGRYPRLSEEWKAVKDLQLEGMEDIKTKTRESAQRIRETEDWRYQVGLASADEYFEQLKARYQASMDALNGYNGKREGKEFDSLTEAMRQDYAALQAAADSALDRIREKMDLGTMSTAQAQAEAQKLIETMNSLGVQPPKALQQFADGTEQARERMKTLHELTKGWLEDFQNGIVDALVECKSLGDMLTNLGKEIEKMALKWMLFGDGKGSRGLLSGLFSFLPGMHSGGIVGSDAPTFMRRIIPKFHTGGVVRPGEQLALLKNGEGVFTPGQMQAIGAGMGGGTGDINININVDNSGNGDMNEEQATTLGKMIKEVVSVQVTEKLYDYKRRGFFKGAAAY